MLRPISARTPHNNHHVDYTDRASLSSDESPIDDNEHLDKVDTALLSTRHEANRRLYALTTGLFPLTRHPSIISEEEQPLTQAPEPPSQQPVTWTSLPSKTQLFVLTLARLSEPLAERSFSAYVFYQLRWFTPSAPASTITSQGGLLTAAFAASQFLTAVWWGRAADTPWIGRKKVLLVGLFGTCVSCVGIGFSKSFAQALLWRALAGALNGNIGVMRTMISEIIKEKKFQSRAFLLMPMCFNVGVVIGPILGGFLADPVHSFPGVFGPGGKVGGKEGVGWMVAFPYALPNIVSGFFILAGALGVVLYLDETHMALRDRPDYGRKLGKVIARILSCRWRRGYQYIQLSTQTPIDDEAIDLQDTSHHPATTTTTPPPPPPAAPTTKPHPSQIHPPPLRQIFTRNVSLTLLTHHLLATHISTFNALIFLLLPAPTSPNTDSHLPFLFTGGLGLSTSQVGLATSIIGIIGLPLQLLLYPPLSEKWGTLRSYKTFLPFSIVAYIVLPYLSLLPSSSSSSSILPKWLLWPLLAFILALQVLSRTFALPSMVILVNNSAPCASALGTVHGAAQMVSSGGRTLGPVVGGWVLGWGLRRNCVGVVWWGMALVAVGNWALLWVVREVV